MSHICKRVFFGLYDALHHGEQRNVCLHFSQSIQYFSRSMQDLVLKIFHVSPSYRNFLLLWGSACNATRSNSEVLGRWNIRHAGLVSQVPDTLNCVTTMQCGRNIAIQIEENADTRQGMSRKVARSYQTYKQDRQKSFGDVNTLDWETRPASNICATTSALDQ